MTFAMRLLLVSAMVMAPAAARGQDPQPSQPQARPTGLPGQLQWTFNFDAGWGNFGFQNSLFQNPKEDVQENLSDQWFEGFIRPALSGSYTGDYGQFYGKVSAVGERTYASVPDLVGPEVSSFQVDDLHAGWRSGSTLTLGENVVDVTIGRAQYQLGRGFLLYDGTSEGGSRGGYWSNARKAFQFAAIGRFTPAPHKAELFYLDRDELQESDSGSRLWGANYEFSVNDQSTVGATYMKWFADDDLKPERDGLSVYDFRAFVAPVAAVPDLAVELEYAREDNDDAALDSNAWYAQGSYQFSAVQWTPRVSYRYAFFQGDDVDTAENEAFDPLFLGFYDWGTWWQGEIAGEYFLSNSNLRSHEYRVHVAPTASIGTGLIYFDFNLDHPASYAPGVTADDVATEIDWYMDWKINANFTASFVAAWAEPGTAAQQAFDRTEHFTYGMVYLGYAF